MYSVFKQLQNGDFVLVGSRGNLEQAMHLVQALKAHWPGIYEVREGKAEVIPFPSGREGKPQHIHLFALPLGRADLHFYIGDGRTPPTYIH